MEHFFSFRYFKGNRAHSSNREWNLREKFRNFRNLKTWGECKSCRKIFWGFYFERLHSICSKLFELLHLISSNFEVISVKASRCISSNSVILPSTQFTTHESTTWFIMIWHIRVFTVILNKFGEKPRHCLSFLVYKLEYFLHVHIFRNSSFSFGQTYICIVKTSKTVNFQ